jgi:hypothetical protein
MKRLIAILFLVIPLLVFGNIVRGGPGERIRGTAPADTLDDSLFVTIRIPAQIGLYVQGNTEFNLGSVSVVYPPLLWPGYYDPTTVAGTNTDGVDVEVFSNSNTMTWYLQTRGNADFSGTIALGQLWYAPNGTANPADGGAPGAPWTAYTTTYTTVISGGKTTGWLLQPQDYVFQAQTDDDPTAGSTATIYYRLYAQ